MFRCLPFWTEVTRSGDIHSHLRQSWDDAVLRVPKATLSFPSVGSIVTSFLSNKCQIHRPESTRALRAESNQADDIYTLAWGVDSVLTNSSRHLDGPGGLPSARPRCTPLGNSRSPSAHLGTPASPRALFAVSTYSCVLGELEGIFSALISCRNMEGWPLDTGSYRSFSHWCPCPSEKVAPNRHTRCHQPHSVEGERCTQGFAVAEP